MGNAVGLHVGPAVHVNISVTTGGAESSNRTGEQVTNHGLPPSNTVWVVSGAATGAALGASIAGPAGALVGATMGALAGHSSSIALAQGQAAPAEQEAPEPQVGKPVIVCQGKAA